MTFEKGAYIKVAYFSIFSILYSFISSKLIEYLKIDEINIGGITFKSITQEIFVGLVIGPIIETLIFQFVIYKIIFYIKGNIQKYLLKKECQFLGFYILISSILFAISHSYSVYYILLMIIPGAVLSYAFYFFKKNYTYPVLYTFLIHFIHNLFIFITEKI
jgi:hypothetical protein